MNNDFPRDEIRRFLTEDEERRKLMMTALDPYAGIQTAATAFAPYQSMRLALKAMDPFGSMRSALTASDLTAQEAEKLSKLARDSNMGWRHHLAHSVRDALEGYSMATRAMDSLLGRRAQSIYENELAKAASMYPRMNFATTIADSIAEQQAKLLADAAKPWELTTSIAEQMEQAFAEQTKLRMADFASPFASISDQIRKDIGAAAGMFDAGEWARRLGMPMIDAASIATVAGQWGAKGALKSLREMGGFDREALRLVIEAMEAEEAGAEEAGDEAPTARGKRGAVSIDTLLGIFAILLTLLIWQSQNDDQEQMEARLRADNKTIIVSMEEFERRTAERIEKLSRALEIVIMQAQPHHEVQFVVRSRGASITKKKGGGAQVSEGLPGQVVTLIAEEGKWIEISYFDFKTGTQHAGWALKKYFMRAGKGQSNDAD